MIDHGLERPDLHALAFALPHVDEKNRKPVGLFDNLIQRRRPHKQEHEIAVECAGGPDFLSMNDVMITVAHGSRLDLGSVGSRRRFGHAEGLEAQFP